MTQPPQENVPYVRGPDMQGPALPYQLSAEERTAAQPAFTPVKRSKAPLVVGIVAVSTLLLCGGLTVAAVLTADGKPSVTAAATPSYERATTGPIPTGAAPTTADVLEATFGQTLILETSVGDEVHFTVFADKTYARSAYGRPEKGVFYGIRAEVKVVKGSAYACFCDFALIAPDGTAYEGTTVGFKGEFNTVQLNAGQRTGGIIVFDVPATAIPGGRIELREGSLFGGDQGFWKIP